MTVFRKKIWWSKNTVENNAYLPKSIKHEFFQLQLNSLPPSPSASLSISFTSSWVLTSSSWKRFKYNFYYNNKKSLLNLPFELQALMESGVRTTLNESSRLCKSVTLLKPGMSPEVRVEVVGVVGVVISRDDSVGELIEGVARRELLCCCWWCWYGKWCWGGWW